MHGSFQAFPLGFPEGALYHEKWLLASIISHGVMRPLGPCLLMMTYVFSLPFNSCIQEQQCFTSGDVAGSERTQQLEEAPFASAFPWHALAVQQVQRG